MDNKVCDLFARSEELLARSREITRKVDEAYQRLLEVQSKCNPPEELPRESESISKRLRVALHRY